MIPSVNLQGKTALITGASRRIGRAISLLLARRGMHIVLHYDTSRREALGLAKEIEALGTRAYLIKMSFAPGRGPLQGRIKRMVQDALKKAGSVDVLVNNAAVFYPTPVGEITEVQVDEFLAVNLKAPFFLAEELGRRMVKQARGKIINIVDWTAFKPHQKYVPYAISKAGLVAATQGLAKAFAPKVQVLSIAPGPILPAKGTSKKQQAKVIQKTLLKRFGDPSDIAQTVRFFCEDTDYITGAFIPVDGGASIF